MNYKFVEVANERKCYVNNFIYRKLKKNLEKLERRFRRRTAAQRRCSSSK